MQHHWTSHFGIFTFPVALGLSYNANIYLAFIIMPWLLRNPGSYEPHCKKGWLVDRCETRYQWLLIQFFGPARMSNMAYSMLGPETLKTSSNWQIEKRWFRKYTLCGLRLHEDDLINFKQQPTIDDSLCSWQTIRKTWTSQCPHSKNLDKKWTSDVYCGYDISLCKWNRVIGLPHKL